MSTPMQQQYDQLKSRYSDAILLFRVGDFYECFGEDAVRAAKILGITLTGRGKGDTRQKMAGIPHHALKTYLPKLVGQGVKTVIVDQIGTPVPGQIVKREVTEIITPGAVIDENLLKENRNNFLAGINLEIKTDKGVEIITAYICMVDVGTGEAKLFSVPGDSSNLENTLSTLNKYNVKEIVVNEKCYPAKSHLLNKNYISSLEMVNTIPSADFNLKTALKELQTYYELNSFKAWGLQNDDPLLGVVNAVRVYLKDELRKDLNVEKMEYLNSSLGVNVPWVTYRALEIFVDSQGGQSGSLFTHLNHTQTAQGRRRLENWLVNVSQDRELLDYRHSSVAELLDLGKETVFSAGVDEFLAEQIDFDRFLTKYKLGRLGPNDLYAFAQAILVAVTKITTLDLLNVSDKTTILYKIINHDYSKLKNIAEYLDSAVNPGFNDLSDYGFIKPEFNAELKGMISETDEGKTFLQNLELQEIKRSGISSLKVKYNKVFGYYIEVSKSNLDKVPADYIRKQTLVNAERYITDELKQWEDRITNIVEVRLRKEQEIFNELLVELGKYLVDISEYSNLIADFDVLLAFAKVARKYGYTRPEFVTTTNCVKVESMAHPVLYEKLQESFVRNDIAMSQQESFYVITGPNMAGKSTYIRSVAILQIMAQVGSFVPAKHAQLSIVDGVFTRVGASDNLAHNESTFMVEMIEMAYILKHATQRSLIILDEVGRGTSTYDGVSLAWAITEHISQKIKANTLFATHYHELIELERTLVGVKNYFVDVVAREKLFFTHKVRRGSLNKSFGVAVAKMAGLNESLISRATEILTVLEAENDIKGIAHKDLNYHQFGLLPAGNGVQNITADLPLGNAESIKTDENEVDEKHLQLAEEILQLDVNKLSPLEILNKISELQDKYK